MQCALSHCQNNWYDNRNFLLFEKKQGEKNGSLAQCMGESLMLYMIGTPIALIMDKSDSRLRV